MDLNLISNFSKRSDESLQKEALAYFERLKSDSSGWRLCADSLVNGQHMDESAVFFCFQVIENHIKTRYELDAEDNRLALRQFVFSWFTSHQHTSNYILNKFAYLVNSVFLIDFPSQKWNSFFSDFLAMCQTQPHCDLFLRILLQINADVADREIPRNPKELERNTLIKDMMRETCLLDLARFWFNIISNYKDSDPATVCLCLEVIGAYVAWIEISLITNDSFMTNLFNLFANCTFRCSVADCFSGILHKGMDPLAKAQLIEQFMNVDSIKMKLLEICNKPVVDENVDDEHCLYEIKISKLMNVIGIELIESFKKLKTKNSANVNGTSEDINAITFISGAIESKFAILCRFLSHKNNDVSVQIHPFSREYIQWLKNNMKPAASSKTMTESVDEKLLIFLRIIIEKCKYSVDYSQEEEALFEEFRKSCKVLFDNLMLVNSSIVISFVCNQLIEPTLVNWRTNNYNFSEIEIALYYFYLIGENLSLIADQKKIESLLQLMITSSISTLAHCSTQSIYFDLVLRYERYFANSLTYLVPQILISFLDERGFKNRHPKMRSKVCHLFNKFVKSQIKSKGNEKQQNFTEDILKRMQDFLKLDIDYDKADEIVQNNNKPKITNIFDEVKYPIRQEDQLYIYETAAILIVSNSNFDANKKQYLLKNLLLQPIWNKFEEVYGKLMVIATASNMNGGSHIQTLGINGFDTNEEQLKKFADQIAHLICLASRTSKGFSNVHTIKSVGVQNIYIESFNLFVKAMTLNLNEDLLFVIQSDTRQFLHRLIVCLEESDIIPMLPAAIENLFLANQQLNARTIQELVPLINQVVTKFKHSWLFQRDLMPFMKRVFLPIVSSFFNLISLPTLSSDETLALQKSYYIFLSVLVINNIMDVFSGINDQIMEQILLTVFQGSIDFPDSVTQKTCFQILRKFIEFFDFSNSTNNGAVAKSLDQPPTIDTLNGPAFAQFVYKSVVPACFIAPLRQPEDAQLMNECILCLKMVLHWRGCQEFGAFLQTQLFPQNFPGYSGSEELIQALFNNDAKVTKSVFKQFYQQFKNKPLT